jgi:hypothetical protein
MNANKRSDLNTHEKTTTKEEAMQEIGKMAKQMAKAHGLEARWEEGWGFVTIQMPPHSDVVTIHPPERRFGESTIIMSQLNWSAMGDQSLGVAEKMVDALDIARMIAQYADLNAEWFIGDKPFKGTCDGCDQECEDLVLKNGLKYCQECREIVAKGGAGGSAGMLMEEERQAMIKEIESM